jgi:hypothetical protein
MEEVFIEQKASTSKTCNKKESRSLQTTSFCKLVCGNLSADDQRNRLLLLQFGLQIEAQKLKMRLPIQNLLDPECSLPANTNEYSTVHCLPEIIDEFYLLVAVVKEGQNRLPSLPELVFQKYDDAFQEDFTGAKSQFLNRLCFLSEQSKEISNLCEGQSFNVLWKLYKVGCVTSSVAHKVHQFVINGRTDPERLIQTVMFYDAPFSSASTQWGTDHENSGVQCLLSHLSDVDQLV